MILLDTHVLVWLTEGMTDLGVQARTKADDALARGGLAVAAISFWEIAMLIQKGRLRMRQPLQAWRADLLEAGLVEVTLTGGASVAAAEFVGLHSDPADRLIIATASLTRAQLMTADRRILGWDGPLNCLDART